VDDDEDSREMLRKAYLGEVSITVWPKKLNELCRQKNIQVLE